MCPSYKGISLLPNVCTVFMSVLSERLKPLFKTQIGSYQCFLHYVISWKRPMKNKSTLTIYLLTAFDSQIRNRYFVAMFKLGTPAMLIRLYKMTRSEKLFEWNRMLRRDGDLRKSAKGTTLIAFSPNRWLVWKNGEGGREAEACLGSPNFVNRAANGQLNE